MTKRRLNIKNLVPRKDSVFKQGYYRLHNPQKYIGDPSKIIFRSSWEKKFATYCDLNDNVVAWSSEPLVIQYFHPIERVYKPYNVDFYMKMKSENGFKEYLVEVKPSKQMTQPEPLKGKLTEKKLVEYNSRMLSYLVNMSKFNAAKEYAENRGWEFVTVSETWLF